MPYYLCKGEGGALSISTSWPRAKSLVHGKSGAWSKRFETRAEAERGLEAAQQAQEISAAGLRGQVWVDGSAIFGEWSACAVWFGKDDPRNRLEVLPPPHTSPRAELAAVLLCLEQGAVNVNIMSDSSFVCLAFERGWPASFPHQDLIAEIRLLAGARRVAVQKVAAHAGIAGNEAVDGMLHEAREARRQ